MRFIRKSTNEKKDVEYMKEIKSGIYCIENKTTHKKYIGQSKDIKDRWRRHINGLNSNVHENDYLQNAWNKYGEEDFDFYVLEYCDIEELDDREVYYIDLYNTMSRDKGYNLRSGGQSHHVMCQESKEKLSQAIKQSYENNEDLRDTRSRDAARQWANPEIRAKVTGEGNGMYGKHHSEETRQKIIDAKIGKKKKSPQLKWTSPVYCIELDQVFITMKDAAKKLSLDSGNISSVCSGKRQTCGGYHWRYATEEEIFNIKEKVS